MRAVEEGRGASPSNYREVLDRLESATEALARKSGAEALRPEWSYAERSLYDRAEVALSE
jgi:hypothetical protein